MPRLTFIDTAGGRHEIEAENGLSVMQVARTHDLGIEGTCDGSLACATCHVILEPEDALRLGVASPEEEDMLDLAVGVQPTSRLACQIRVTDELDGLILHLPADG
jgi:ferredoxin, 2Fe-2S